MPTHETQSQANSLEQLVSTIQRTNHYFLEQVQKQVNTALTLRNWMIGLFIVEYEQFGSDRAEYGERLLSKLAERLKRTGIKGSSPAYLYVTKQLYLTYPQMVKSLPKGMEEAGYQLNRIFQSLIGKSESSLSTPVEILLNRLSFTHFIELLKADTPLKRAFYETQAITNNWSVRELQRAMSSLLFERTGLSADKQAVLENHRKGSGMKPSDIFRSPYFLEFLGLPENTSHSETDLERTIIQQLQDFLLELGRGFCFEARQKRITFDNTHYRIDLVFYHRILKCHVLLDLKMGSFTPADAGQMNMYLNYFKDQEMQEGDNPPIGIILCAGKNETLVKYATAGLSQQLFVSKYLMNLPSELELERVVEEEQAKVS